MLNPQEIEKLNTHRLDKVHSYLQSQIQLNQLTKEHLKSVIESTETATSQIFGQLITLNSSMDTIAEKLTSIYEHKKIMSKNSITLLENTKKLSTEINDFKNTLLSDKPKNNNSLDTQLEILSDLVHHLHKFNDINKELGEQNTAVCINISETIKEFAKQIIDTVSQLQFQDITRQQIEIICKYIDDTDTYMQQLCQCIKNANNHCENDCLVPDFNVNNVLKYYVMESQRETHDKVMKAFSKTDQQQ
ncbi:chemotaxis sensory transducer [Candidatus Magnetoovum chiemensis]|nr:chemotaxis sensory transducer [Candidatus Magnetoovum chiemensis]